MIDSEQDIASQRVFAAPQSSRQSHGLVLISSQLASLSRALTYLHAKSASLRVSPSSALQFDQLAVFDRVAHHFGLFVAIQLLFLKVT